MSRKRAGSRTAAVLAAVSAVSMGALTLQAPPVHATGSTPWVLPLKVDGNRITDSSTNGPNGTGVTVVLNGIHRDGPQIDPVKYGPPRFPNDGEISWITTGRTGSWNANVVRVPVSAPHWTGTCPALFSANAQYRADVDAEISAITSRGALALLDLHSVAPGCKEVAMHAMPDADATTFWQSAASRYASNPLVAFELYNEPHYVDSDVWRNGTTGVTQTDCRPAAPDPDPIVNRKNKLAYVACVNDPRTVKWQAVGMQSLYQTVSAAAPGHLVVVDGNDYATVPPTVLLDATAGNLVYALHPYMCSSPKDQKCPTGTDNHANTVILQRWQPLAATVPVLVSEAGWPVYPSGDGTGNDYTDGSGFYQGTIDFAQAQNPKWGMVGFAFDGYTKGMFDMITPTSTCRADTVSTCQPNTTAQPLFTLMQGQPRAPGS